MRSVMGVLGHNNEYSNRADRIRPQRTAYAGSPARPTVSDRTASNPSVEGIGSDGTNVISARTVRAARVGLSVTAHRSLATRRPFVVAVIIGGRGAVVAAHDMRSIRRCRNPDWTADPPSWTEFDAVRDHCGLDLDGGAAIMDRDFYATMAQVLPILLLALVFDSGYLKRLRDEKRQRRKKGQAGGVLFWTPPVVRAYAFAVVGATIAAIGACMLVLAGVLPAGRIIRGVLIAVLLIELATLLTRILFDFAAATRTQPEAPGAFDGVPGGEQSVHAGGVADQSHGDGAGAAHHHGGG